MPDRREFLKTGAAVLAAGIVPTACSRRDPAREVRKPLVVSTWNHGLPANAAAWEILGAGGRALDAVEAGVRVTEADPTGRSVGIGGLPDRDGHVTLDACIMDERGECGSVAFLQHIMHPISVARRVMERTPHVMLAGEGALRFALDQGFERTELLTDDARREWLAWREEARYEPRVNAENHDTISMLALDADGNLSGACTTSGLAYKMHGRVGDSPIIGAALFVDNEVGAACATGHGEFVMRTLGSFLVVEMMRRGASPQEACEEAIGRIVERHPDRDDIQVGYLALSREGAVGAHAIFAGFNYATHDGAENVLVDSTHHS